MSRFAVILMILISHIAILIIFCLRYNKSKKMFFSGLLFFIFLIFEDILLLLTTKELSVLNPFDKDVITAFYMLKIGYVIAFIVSIKNFVKSEDTKSHSDF